MAAWLEGGTPGDGVRQRQAVHQVAALVNDTQLHGPCIHVHPRGLQDVLGVGSQPHPLTHVSPRAEINGRACLGAAPHAEGGRVDDAREAYGALRTDRGKGIRAQTKRGGELGGLLHGRDRARETKREQQGVRGVEVERAGTQTDEGSAAPGSGPMLARPPSTVVSSPSRSGRSSGDRPRRRADSRAQSSDGWGTCREG